MTATPYISAAGVVTPDEARWAGLLLRKYCDGLFHRPGLGILVSRKTLEGRKVKNRRYPVAALVPAILAAMPTEIFSTIHYNSHGGAPLDEELAALLEVCGIPDGIQLNIVRPDLDALGRFRRVNPGVEIILQVNHTSLGADTTPEAVVSYVATYAAVIDHALLDLSGGRGRALDSEWAATCLRKAEMSPTCRYVTFGIAGGLGPNSGALVARMITMIGHSRFSLDAESAIRVPVSDPIAGAPYQDVLHPELLAGYASACVRQLAFYHP